MKKVNFFLTTLLSLAILTSCLNTDNDNTTNPIQGGVEIYNSMVVQNKMSRDAGELAIRLNILLSSLPSLDRPGDPVTITVNGREYDLKEYLFNQNTITNDEGIYKIEFPTLNFYGVNDTPRIGTFIIDTGNILLEEMEPGDRWTISYEGDRYGMIVNDGSARRQYYVEYGSPYYITCTATREWRIHCSSIKGYHESDNDKQWQGDFNIDYTLSYDMYRMNYTAMRTSKFTMSGNSSGRITSLGVEGRYDIQSPLVYKMACSPPIMTSGVERVQIPEYTQNNPDYYPEDYVRVKWRNTTNEDKTDGCAQYFLMSYNGIVYDYLGVASTEVF